VYLLNEKFETERTPVMKHSLEGWDISQTSDDADWVPWGSTDDALAQVLATGDGYHVVLVRAQAGYTSNPHVHAHTEFLYVIDGTIRTQGTTMTAGNAYAAAVGSSHTDFRTDTGATYVSIFKL
jgi:quercetin dioxygenase-like cupin family protein